MQQLQRQYERKKGQSRRSEPGIVFGKCSFAPYETADPQWTRGKTKRQYYGSCYNPRIHGV